MGENREAVISQEEIIVNLEDKRLDWIFNPRQFVEEVLGIGVCDCKAPCRHGLDPLQMQMIENFATLIRCKWKWGHSLYDDGITLTPEEDEIRQKIGESVKSAKGVGKTTGAAIIGLWFMTCFEKALVVILGPKYDQVKDSIWPEIGKWMGHAEKVYGEDCLINWLFESQSDIIYCKHVAKNELKKRHVMRIKTFPKNAGVEEQKASIQGEHDDNMLFLVDEASGVPDHIFEPIESTLTSPVNAVFAIFNPNKNTGWAIETHKKMKDKWYTMHISAYDSTLVTDTTIAYMMKKYGRDSNKFRVSVLGLEPIAEEGALIPWEWIQDAKDIWYEYEPQQDDPQLLGADIGGGGDPSMICDKKGMKVEGYKSNTSDDSVVIQNWIIREATSVGPDEVFIDKNGIGNGPFCNVRATRLFNTTGVNTRIRAEDDRFEMLRDQLLWRLREAFEAREISIDPKDDELEGELSLLKFDDEGTYGKIKVISKKDKKYQSEMQEKLGYKSPNKVDSLALTFYRDLSMHKKRKSAKKRKQREMRKSRSVDSSENKFSWMGR